ncbi:MAG: hypothetical protein HOC24_07040 [Deltaproteobacteria bacterium]|jgi:hypothetical protein|nr:hypothetical protein [Deltaproteobacteria bacterium]
MSIKLKTTTYKINKKRFNNWLNTAIWFSIWHVSDEKHVKDARDFIFKDIGEKYQLSKKKSRDKKMLMLILLNLWVGLCTGSPIMIYRDRSRYGKGSAYNKVFIRHDRTMRLLDSLLRKGYLYQKIGYLDRKDGRRRVTRIWGTEKLLRRFINKYNFSIFEGIYQDKNVDLVQLNHKEIRKRFDKKNNKWIEKEYTIPDEFDETDLTLEMEYNLRRYNALAKNQTIRIKMLGEDLVKPKVLTDTILGGLITGSIRYIDSALDYKDPVENQCYGDKFTGQDLPVFNQESGLQISQFSYGKHSYSTISILNEDTLEPMNIDTTLISITHTLHSQQWQSIEQKNGKKHALFLYLLWLKKMFNLIKVNGRDKKDREHKKYLLMKQKRPLKDFGIKYLEFEINKKYLHRVFNEGSTEFDKGGRFWGPFYQGIHKEVRDCICINGNQTVEVDFSGMHIRMLYHRQGEKYTKDPYMIGRKDERTKYKFVSLISINADRNEASGAIFNKLKREGIRYRKGKGSIKKMMDAFMDYHYPIRDDLFKARGLGLQYQDSQIMERILMRLLDHGIAGLCMHDSVIVEEQYCNLLWKIMMDEYEKVMGYAPVVD